eukprot:TRINITY_DN9209_c0_g1_i1.p1 TRINITY_DN9209_c0_g1~~TRINITY_DN9209_c0_g1_i1.p1  ORF type:complete len:442 (+),score=89.01 TRINITY_DN9209_c0_g1_i1:28-1353(+)
MALRVVDVLRKKRDGLELSTEEIQFMINGITTEEIPNYQISAWLMACFIRGMTGKELAALTSAMIMSGSVIDLSSLPAAKVDKHSTGGVGDKTSMVLTPIVAAGGLIVPMISGRGLGHTGGTLDKLESIPNFRVDLSLDQFKEALTECGCSIIGQTSDLAPADKKLYALRDVTATIDNVNLICASIMSKKLAEGLDSLVLDVKVGSGAFMKTEEDASILATIMVGTGKLMGKNVVALLTEMEQPLGHYVGNALEIYECLEILKGRGEPELKLLCLELSAWMFYLGGKTESVEEGLKLATELLDNGAALKKFQEMVRVQGGNLSVFESEPKANHTFDFVAENQGLISSVMCEEVGVACVVLGGGREKQEDLVDHAVGFVIHKRVGDFVLKGESILSVYYNSTEKLEKALIHLKKAYNIDSCVTEAPQKKGKQVQSLIRKIIQ